MARKKKAEEHENHERWLISYADFITLLFAFFVVMYSVSSVNEGKYRVLSQSMISAFGKPVRSFEPIQEGSLVRSKQKTMDRLLTPPSARIPGVQNMRGGSGNNKDAKGTADAEKMSEIAQQLEDQLAALIDDEMITVRLLEDWLEVEIKSNVLFASGSSTLAGSAVPVLEKIADALRASRNIIRVEGFTDNVPINTPIFPSNWELSAARSATVVRLFSDYQIEPGRMVSVGYGEYRPIADNDTVDGRAQNRRVVIVLLQKETYDPPELLAPNQALTSIETIDGLPQEIDGLPQEVALAND